MYLRDALPEYSTVDPEMTPVPISASGDVPVNKVRGIQDAAMCSSATFIKGFILKTCSKCLQQCDLLDLDHCH